MWFGPMHRLSLGLSPVHLSPAFALAIAPFMYFATWDDGARAAPLLTDVSHRAAAHAKHDHRQRHE